MGQIQIDRGNTIQSREEIKMGQPVWTVGQGGSSSVCKPYFGGYIIAFGTSKYTFLADHQKATGFTIRDDADNSTFITVIRNEGRNNTISKAEIASMNIGDGLKPGNDYPLGAGRYVSHLSLMDHNAQGGGYNNWYLCDSEEKAMAVYEEMLSKWTDEYEAKRHSQELKWLFDF